MIDNHYAQSVGLPSDAELWDDIPPHLCALADQVNEDEIEFVLDWLRALRVIRRLASGDAR